jgi:sulfur carrier protein ThiS
MVDIRIYGALWDHLEPRLTVDLEGDEVSAADLLVRLAIDPDEVGIVTVNGRQVPLTERIPPEARVCIFSPLSGG